MRNITIFGEIVKIGKVREISNSWTTFRQELLIKQQNGVNIVVTLEDHKRGFYQVRDFKNEKFEEGMRVTLTCELVGVEHKEKVINRLIAKSWLKYTEE